MCIRDSNEDQLKLLVNKLNYETNQTKKRYLISQVGSKVVSILTILLNLSTIILSLVAIFFLSVEINNNSSNLTNSAIIMPLFVACFTVLLFIISIWLMIYNSKTKVAIYEEEAQIIQYLILKIKYDQSYQLEQLITIINELKLKENQASQINYRKLLTTALETRHEKK